MSVVAFSGINYTLFPIQADYGYGISWQRSWQNSISTSLFGNESRSAVRQKPLISLSWTITPKDIQEQQELEDLVRAASKSGYGCSPYWGRGSILSADTSDLEIPVSSTWNWSVGDNVFLLDCGSGVYNLRSISDVGPPLVPSVALTQVFGSGTYIWPLIFGKFSFKTGVAKSGAMAPVTVTLSEIASQESKPIGELPDPGTGIGVWKINSTFVIGS